MNRIIPTSYLDKLKALYEISKNFILDMAKLVKIGMSGAEIDTNGKALFKENYIPKLISKGIINKLVEIERNIGHWIKDYVEGPHFGPGVVQKLKENDIICLELPLGSKALDLTVNYEIQGIMKPEGFVEF